MAIRKRTLIRWLEQHDFVALPTGKTSHRRYRHASGEVVSVATHGSGELSKKHTGMLVRALERAGFDRNEIRRDLE